MWIALLLVLPVWRMMVDAADAEPSAGTLSLRTANNTAALKPTTGFLHVYDSGVWHPVCTYNWRKEVIRVVCTEMGFAGGSTEEEEEKALGDDGVVKDDTTDDDDDDNGGGGDGDGESPKQPEIQYETFAECGGDEKNLDDCDKHEWVLAAMISDGHSAPCYTHPSKRIRCDSMERTEVPPVPVKQPITQTVTPSETRTILQPIIKPGTQTIIATTKPTTTTTSSATPTTTTTITTTRSTTTTTSTTQSKPIPTRPTPTQKTVTSEDTPEPEVTAHNATQPSAILSKTLNASSKDATVDKSSPVIVIRPTHTNTPRPFSKADDKNTDALVKLASGKTSTIGTDKTSTIGTTEPIDLDVTTEEMQYEDEVLYTDTNTDTETNSDAYTDTDTTLSPLDRYLYFKQSDLVSVTTPTTTTTTTTTTTDTNQTTPPPPPPTTQEKRIYMVTPKNYHKPTSSPSSATSHHPPNPPLAPNPRAEDTAHPTDAPGTKHTVVHPGLRPGYPWGGHYGSVGDREIDKLHPRFLDSKYQFDFKDCPGYTNTFVGTRQEGQITSPAYPEKYPNHSHCVWRIHVHPSQHIRLQIMDLWTEKGDTLKIFESARLGEQPHLIRSYQGKVLDLEQLLESRANNSITVLSNHSVVYMEFASNSKGRARGFLVDYKALPHMPPSLSRLLVGDNIQFIQTLVGVLVAMALVVMVAAVVIYRLKYPASKSDVRRRLYEEAVNDLHRDYSTMSKDSQPNGEAASLNVFNKSTLQLGGRDVAFENPAFSTDTPDMSSVFMEAGKSDDEVLNWGNDDEEETSVIFSIFSRKNKKKKLKKNKKGTLIPEEQTAIFDDQPDTPCDHIEIESHRKEQAGFNSIQSAFGQSSSLGVNPRKPNPRAIKTAQESNLIDFDSPKRAKRLKELKDIKEPEPEQEPKRESKPPPKNSPKNSPPELDDDDEPDVVVDVNAKSLDSDTVGRVTAEMISPREFICPITTKIMKQPVRAPDGFTYEKRAIIEWIDRHGLSPISRTQMKAEDLLPAEGVSLKIKEWRKKRRVQRQKMETQLSKAKDAGAAASNNVRIC